jgi:hypothetical protein
VNVHDAAAVTMALTCTGTICTIVQIHELILFNAPVLESSNAAGTLAHRPVKTEQSAWSTLTITWSE